MVGYLCGRARKFTAGADRAREVGCRAMAAWPRLARHGVFRTLRDVCRGAATNRFASARFIYLPAAKAESGGVTFGVGDRRVERRAALYRDARSMAGVSRVRAHHARAGNQPPHDPDCACLPPALNRRWAFRTPAETKRWVLR